MLLEGGPFAYLEENIAVTYWLSTEQCRETLNIEHCPLNIGLVVFCILHTLQQEYTQRGRILSKKLQICMDLS